MAKYIHQQVRSHPYILALEASRRRGRVMVNAHELAVWLAYEPSIGSGGWDVQYEIAREGWWSPVKRSHGDRLVADLVDGLLKEWARWRVETAGPS